MPPVDEGFRLKAPLSLLAILRVFQKTAFELPRSQTAGVNGCRWGCCLTTQGNYTIHLETLQIPSLPALLVEDQGVLM